MDRTSTISTSSAEVESLAVVPVTTTRRGSSPGGTGELEESLAMLATAGTSKVQLLLLAEKRAGRILPL